MLFKKNQFMNWWTPTGKTVRKRMGDVLRVYCNGKRHTVTLGHGVCEQLDLNPAEVRAAFVLDDDNPVVTFNPVPGVPFVTLRATGNAKSPQISSVELADSFAKRFDLSKRCKYYDFKLEGWERFNGMSFFTLIPQEGDCDE